MFQASQVHHQEVSIVQAAYGIRPLRTTKTSAEGKNTIGCLYNLDLLMMDLWGLKHVEERWQQLLYVNKKAVYQVGNKELKKK